MFTSQLNKLIEEKNTNINKVSKDTGIPVTTMYDWSNGRTHPRFDYVVKLSSYFGVPLEYFAEGDGAN